MSDARPVPRRRPTMVDVAAAADVSIKTVSRVVNGDDYVSADKAERVHEAIARLGFRRNEYARRLRQGGTATIGLVVEDASDPFYSVLTRAVEEVAFDQGYMLLTSSSAEDPRRAERLVEALAGRAVEGLIIAPAESMDPGFLADELRDGRHMVFVDRPVASLDADTVLADNRSGAEQGAALLLAHGHRRIAFFGDEELMYTSIERRKGFVDAHRAASVPIDEDLFVMASPHSITPSVDALIDRIFAAEDPPSAVFSGNNRWSINLLRALRSRSAPIGFVGFDDFELADVLQPPISVVAQDASAMGRLAGELLFRRIAGDHSPPQRVQLPTTIIRRGSGEIPGPFADG